MKPEAHIALVLAGVAVTAATAFSGGVLRSTLAIWPRNTPQLVRTSTKALTTFCPSLGQTDPQKVALQKDLQLLEGSCSENRRAKRAYTSPIAHGR